MEATWIHAYLNNVLNIAVQISQIFTPNFNCIDRRLLNCLRTFPTFHLVGIGKRRCVFTGGNTGDLSPGEATCYGAMGINQS